MESKTIYALIDYKGNFESKYNATPYRSGMDKSLVERYFSESGYRVSFIKFSEVMNFPRDFWAGKPIIYNSSEDTDYHYKSFIEDIIYYLELCNGVVIPSYRFLKANNNKVFMELLRLYLNDSITANIKSRVFGTLEEALNEVNSFNYPAVFKQSAGAMSEGVGIALNKKDLIRNLKKISKTSKYLDDLWEFGRSLKHKEYKKESKFKKKFIIQDFIPGLNGDYKILVFSNKYFVLKRNVRKGDFRASGSGLRSFEREIPDGLLDFATNIINTLDVPNASLDIAFNGSNFFLIEFQCLYFGSYTLTFSPFHWIRNKCQFDLVEAKSELEFVYVNSIVDYLGKQEL
jgi:glutathione synthase/RimK-type ligase-like ATP-grasp enzyme